MAYNKTPWVNDQYDTPADTFTIEDLGGGQFRIRRAGNRTQVGTPLSAANLNKAETQYDAAKADLDASLAAALGHKHTGVAGEGPILPVSSIVQGAGSGLDADRLDGFHLLDVASHVLTLPFIRRLANMPLNWADAGVVAEGVLYLILRSTSGGTPSFHKYDPSTGAYTSLAAPAATIIKQLVYQDGYIWSALANGDIVRYDIAGNTWATYADAGRTSLTISWLLASAASRKLLVGPDAGGASRVFSTQTLTFSAGPAVTASRAAYWQSEDAATGKAFTIAKAGGNLSYWAPVANTWTDTAVAVVSGTYTNFWGGFLRRGANELRLYTIYRYADGMAASVYTQTSVIKADWSSAVTTSTTISVGSALILTSYPNFSLLPGGYTNGATQSYALLMVEDPKTALVYVLQQSDIYSGTSKGLYVME